MRVVIACGVVVLAVLAALGLAHTQNVFSSLAARIGGTSATAAMVAAEAPRMAAKTASSTVAMAAPKDQDRPAPLELNAAVVAVPSPEPQPASAASPAPAPAAVVAQAATPAPAAGPTAAAPPAPAAVPASAPAAAPAPTVCPGNPNALGVSRTVEIDTTGGPGFGTQHFKEHDFLKPGEVILTFDDGPWLNHTDKVLAALAHHCTKAIFFSIGKHATYYPEILQRVAAAGHTIGSHTWSHQDLSKKTLDEAKTEIELAISAVHQAVGDAARPLFRFPALRHPPEVVTYLGQRNISIWSTDIDSQDWRLRNAGKVIKSVMTQLGKRGKGIILMHDFQRDTADAIGTLLDQLKAGGYKIVAVRTKAPVTTLPEYDAMLPKMEDKLPTVSDRPTDDIVKTVN